jgi:IS5 family transposase
MNSFFMMGAQDRVGNENQLIKLAKLINWENLRPELKGLFKVEESLHGGRTPYDSLQLFKAILLGQWHNLSDPKLEESLRVRLDFMLFTGFEISEDLPDETTLCRFRNRLIEKGVDKKLFKKINQQLELLGLRIESAKGAIVDATIIESAARPRRTIEVAEDREEDCGSEMHKNQDSVNVQESVDPNAKWLKKGKRFYFGYKGFVRAAEGSGFIQKVEMTPANAAEVKQLDSLISDFNGDYLYGDKAYKSKNNAELLKSKKVKDRILYKGFRNTALTHWQKIFNKLASKKRYLVEQGFGTLKRRFDCGRSSYMGIEKVLGQFQIKAICFNLLKAVNQMACIT